MVERRTKEMKVRRRRGLPLLAAIGVAGGGAYGCDGQADPGYRGEPLISVSGRVEAGLEVGEVEVGVLWVTSGSDFSIECTGEANADGAPSACAEACGEITCENLEAWDACASSCPDVTYVVSEVTTPSVPFLTGGVGQTTPAVGEFPAQFSLDILEPPPDEVLIASTTGERLAIGLFVALDPAGAPFRVALSELTDHPAWLLGGSESHMLVYMPDGLDAESLWSQATGIVGASGFQLIAVTPPAELDQNPEFSVVPSGDASQISLRIDSPDALAWPVLF
jgi:hypothetical protein